MLIRTLVARLRADVPELYAGLVIGPDGAIQVFAVGDDQRLLALVNATRLTNAAQVDVHVVPKRRHSLATLERVHEKIRSRYDAIAALGIRITQSGVDVRANKVRISVLELTPEAVTRLSSEFGADRVEVVQGGLWRPVSAPGG